MSETGPEPWIATTAKVTTCTYRTDPLRAMAFGLPTTKNFCISFDYYAHGRLYSDHDSIPLTYNPLDPAQNSLTDTPTPAPAGKPPIFAIALCGTVLLALGWLAMLHGCH